MANLPHMSETPQQVSVDRFWTVPNAFSLLRMVLTVPTIYFFSLGPAYVWATFAVVVVMIVSDVLDGYLARHFGEITRWGKILDPLADKVAIGAITVSMILFRDFPLWLVVAVLMRDGVILMAGIYLARQYQVIVSANIWGKLTTLVMSFLLLAFLWNAETLQPPLIWLSSVLLGVSLVSYGVRFFQVVRES